jgi:hypothetical protein
MEKMMQFERAATTYNREEVAEGAMIEAKNLLLDRFSGFEKLDSNEKISALENLMIELSATAEGTDIPLNNKNRYVVEALAKLCVVETARLNFESVLARHPELA